MADLEDVFYKAQTDLIFSGHVHAYERSYRSYKMKKDASGPYYIVSGVSCSERAAPARSRLCSCLPAGAIV